LKPPTRSLPWIFFTAVKRGDATAVQALISSGADLNEKDHNGMTPLMHAVDFESVSMVQMILKAKVRVEEGNMQIKFVSVSVDDQDKALGFYTKVLGFQKMADIPMGEYRWLTVISPDGIEGVELVLEPMAFLPAKVYQKAMFEAGIPAAAFTTTNIKADYERLSKIGVKFKGEPVSQGPITSTMFEDTCGNLIHLVQAND
jgi:catechol 2,3-dioxygenase-like lactoylglutathione lyase family enzyme